MCLHLVNVAVPRYQAKKLLSGGAKILKNLEEETGKTLSHSSLPALQPVLLGSSYYFHCEISF